MPGFESLAQEGSPTRKRLRYRYGDTTVRLDYEADRVCLTLICQDFSHVPPVPTRAHGELDEEFLTEWVRQEIGVYFEPEQYLVPIGGNPIVIVRAELAAGVTIRATSGNVVEVVHRQGTAERTR